MPSDHEQVGTSAVNGIASGLDSNTDGATFKDIDSFFHKQPPFPQPLSWPPLGKASPLVRTTSERSVLGRHLAHQDWSGGKRSEKTSNGATHIRSGCMRLRLVESLQRQTATIEPTTSSKQHGGSQRIAHVAQNLSVSSMPPHVGRSLGRFTQIRYHHTEQRQEQKAPAGSTLAVHPVIHQLHDRDLSQPVIRQAHHEGDTLITRSHDTLSVLAARERRLLDLKEGTAQFLFPYVQKHTILTPFFGLEVRREEQEVQAIRFQWKESVTAALATSKRSATYPSADKLNIQAAPLPTTAPRTQQTTSRGTATHGNQDIGARLASFFAPQAPASAHKGCSKDSEVNPQITSNSAGQDDLTIHPKEFSADATAEPTKPSSEAMLSAEDVAPLPTWEGPSPLGSEFSQVPKTSN